MGLKPDALEFLTQAVAAQFRETTGLRMLELGNLMIKQPGRPRQTAKTYFQTLGFEHTSFDLNARDGALPIDLSQPVPDRFHGRFDIVTNSGTSEHVEPLDGQYNCFANIHNCLRPGGLMVHIVPEAGSFPGHCPFYYTPDFFQALADLNDYEIQQLKRLDRKSNFLVAAALIRKTDRPFTPEKQALLDQITQRPCRRDQPPQGQRATLKRWRRRVLDSLLRRR